MMADGNFYVDTRLPNLLSDSTAVTIGATNKAILPAGSMPTLGANYFGYAGKAVRIRMFGRMNTAASAGTQTFTFLWGTGADANGTAIASSAAITMTNSLVNTSFLMEMVIRARTVGSAGTLFGTGFIHFLNSVTTTAAASTYMIPATAPAASASVDLTAANVISPQVLATTSTTNTIQVHDFLFEALN